MFMQIIQGKVTDVERARRLLDRWQSELQPGAKGWLGGTYGVTDDGMLLGCVRFEDAAAAQANSFRPEQGMWWQEMEQCFTGPVTFHNCDDVRLLLGGGSDEARFVQVIQGRVRDRERFLGLVDSSGELISRYRPDILGATIAIDEDGVVTETIAFTDEAAARKAEQQQLPAEAREVVDAEMGLLEDVQFLDLHSPWFATRS